MEKRDDGRSGEDYKFEEFREREIFEERNGDGKTRDSGKLHTVENRQKSSRLHMMRTAEQ